ncbi:MAG TPA: small multi-drug export protein [Anaerovoracaceae bacterium]|nr:small multi-drug export protein [Anaerovoracaceae bacterium]
MTILFGETAKAMLLTLFMSMLPIIELRGAIPVGISEGLGFYQAFIIAVIGNLIPVPFIVLFIRSIFNWLRVKSEGLNRLVERMEAKADTKKELVKKYEWWGLVLIVAIPLPGTGAWTGSLVAAILDIRLKRAFPAIALGVLIAGAVVLLLSYSASAVLI